MPKPLTPEEIARDLLREYRWQVPDHSDVMADQIVAAVRPVIEAEALREAANEIYAHRRDFTKEGEELYQICLANADSWLDKRADAIEEAGR